MFRVEFDDDGEGALGDAGGAGGFGVVTIGASADGAVWAKRVGAKRASARKEGIEGAGVLREGGFGSDFVVNPGFALLVVASDDVGGAEGGGDVGLGDAGFNVFLNEAEGEGAVVGRTELLGVLSGGHATGQRNAEGEKPKVLFHWLRDLPFRGCCLVDWPTIIARLGTLSN